MGEAWRRHNSKGQTLWGHNSKGRGLEETQLQGAFLGGAQLQGAFLREAQLQGAFLREAQLQGAYLLGVTLQGANLQGAHLQGVVSSSQSFPLESFAERMRRGINRESDFARVAFEGGLSPDDIDEIVSGLPDFGSEKTRLRSLLKQHASPTASNKLPKNSGAIVGKYKKEEAEEWIAEYQEAMSAVPKADNGQ